MPYVLPTLPLSSTSSFSSDHSYSNSLSLSPSPSACHFPTSSLGMSSSSPSTASSSSTASASTPSTPSHSHAHTHALFDRPASSAFSHDTHPPIPRSRSKPRFEDPDQQVASPSPFSSWPLNENANHFPAPAKTEVELSSSPGLESVTLTERNGIPLASGSKSSDSDSRSSLTTTNEEISIIEDSNLPSPGPGNVGSVDKVPAGSFAQARKEGLKLRMDVRDLAARSFWPTTGVMEEKHEQVHSLTRTRTRTTNKPTTANMLSLKEMKEASMPRSFPPSNSNSALDPPHLLAKHGRSQSSHQLSQMSSIKQDCVHPPETPQHIRKKSGELVKPSLKPGRSSMFASSTPHSDAAHKKGRGGKGGSVPIGKLGGLSVSLDALPPIMLGSQSEPTTPTGSSKSVHFDAKLEHVKLFLAEQKPLAVSRDGSPTETSEGATEDSLSAGASFNKRTENSEEERERRDAAVRKSLDILAVNMPIVPALKYLSEHSEDEHVKLESLSLSEDASGVRGLVLVRNLAFAKWVAARFTMDRWQTTSEVSARYVTSVPGMVRAASSPPLSSSSLPPSALTALKDGSPRRKGKRDEGDWKEDPRAYDRFEFFIRLTDFMGKIWEKTLHLCVRYATEGYAEAWDNNGGQNYTVVFKRKMFSRPRQFGKRVGATVRWGIGAPDDDDHEDDGDDGVGIGMKVAALKKTLEKTMLSSGSSSTEASGMGTPPKDERTSIAAEPNETNSFNQSGPTAFGNSRSAQDVLLRVGKQQYSPTQSLVSSPTGAKRMFFMPGGDVPLSPHHARKEGSLAGRYDLGSSLKNAAAGGSSPNRKPLPVTSGIPFPAIGSPLRSPVSPASASGMPPKTLGSSFIGHNFTSTPVTFSSFRSTSRGSPRDAAMFTQSQEVSTGSELGHSRNLSPFRTSSDTDIPASLHRSGFSAPFEFSAGDEYSKGKGKVVMPDKDIAERRDCQESYFASPIDGLDGNGTKKTKGVVKVDGKDNDISPPPTVSRFLPVPQGESNTSYDFGLSISPPFSDANWSGFGSMMNNNKDSTSIITFPSIGSSTSVESSESEGHPKKPCQGCMDDISSSSSAVTSVSSTSNSSALSTPLLSPTETVFAPKRDEPPSNTNEPHNLDSILDQFCFYTGSNGVSSVHRSYSTSSVEEFFAHGGHSAPEIPLLDHSGRTTPTPPPRHYNIPRSSRPHSPDAWNNYPLNTSSSPTPLSQRSPMRIQQQPILG